MNIEKVKEKIDNTRALFYGELEWHLDNYLPKFFSVEVKDVGFDESHPLNTLEFWFTVSWLSEMDFLEYGTSPRGAWLTDEGKEFKEFILKGGTVSEIIHKKESQ